MLNRRQTLALMAVPLMAGPVFAQEMQEYPIVSDDGAAIGNYRIPSELDPAILAGVVWKGRASADVIFYEFFDYNCAYCRKAAGDVDALIQSDPNLRVGLVNNPILSIGSMQAAKVEQAVLRLHGPRVAYEFHLKMFLKHGQRDGLSALGVARDMGLDARALEATADSSVVADVMSRQARLAANLGLSTTPSFAIAGIGIVGWPGAKTLRSIVANVRKCDRPTCPSVP